MSNDVQFKRVPLDALTASPHNYNSHPQAQIADLKASLMRYKQVKPVVAQQVAGEESYILLAGHGITEAAKELYRENPAKYAHLNAWAIAIAPASWSILDAKGYMVSDNELSRKAEPDDNLLAALLQEQADAGFDLATLGSDEKSLRQMLESLGDELLGEGFGDNKEDEQQEHEAGSLLALLNVTIADPTHQVHTGEVWSLGKHFLICAHVFKDWTIWTQYLKDDTCLFLPFAGPLVPLSKKADSHTLVMVQPDTYIAGHVLDRYAEIHGASSVKMVKQFTLTEDEPEPEEEGECDDE